MMVILGAVAIPGLPWPRIRKCAAGGAITTNFLAATAQDLEKTVAQPIEEQLVASMASSTIFRAAPTTAR